MKKIKHIVTNILVKNLLKAVTEDEILVISGKDWIIGRRKLSKDETDQLKQEAKSLRESLLYRLLLKEIKYTATIQRYDEAKTADDMIFGKAMIYNFYLIQKFIRNISAL